jgi:hypothetical protein
MPPPAAFVATREAKIHPPTEKKELQAAISPKVVYVVRQKMTRLQISSTTSALPDETNESRSNPELIPNFSRRLQASHSLATHAWRKTKS